MGRNRQNLRWHWMALPVILAPVGVFFISRAAIHLHPFRYAVLLSSITAMAIIGIAAAIGFLRRRCPACGKLRWKSASADGREILACRSCGYEEATRWVYKAGGSLH